MAVPMKNRLLDPAATFALLITLAVIVGAYLHHRRSTSVS